MIYPVILRTIAEQAAREHMDDLNLAKELAEKKCRALPDFAVLAELLMMRGLHELIHEARSKVAREVRRAGRNEDGSQVELPLPKVQRGATSALADAYEQYFSYPVAGRTLGNLLGEELEELAAAEFKKGDGFYFRGRLLQSLVGKVSKGKTVREAVAGKTLERLYRKAEVAPNVNMVMK